MPRHLLRSWSLGCALAVGFGLLEAAVLYFGGRVEVGGPRIFFSTAVIYLGLATCAALPLGLAVGLVDRLRGGRLEPGGGLYGAVYVAFALASSGCYVANTRFLGGATDPSSLAVDAVFFLAGVPLLTLLLRKPMTAVAEMIARPWRVLRIPYWLAVAAIALAPLLGPDPTTGAPPPGKRAGPAAPNVLFLLIDTLRADHLGCYGYTEATGRETSPRLDALAERSVLFERCISAAPHTKPSTASILTGLYPPTHDVQHYSSKLPEEATTLHEHFHDAGYRTSLMSANSFLSPTYGFGRGVERYRGALVNPVFQLFGAKIIHRVRRITVDNMGLWRGPWDFMRAIGNYGYPTGEYQRGMKAGTIQREFLAWIDEIGADRWFAYLQYMEPHDPYAPAPEFRIFDNPADPEEATRFPSDSTVMFLPHSRGKELPEDERMALVNNYDACIREVDTRIGELLDALEARGALENTIVVVTADHGEEFYDHGAWGHGQSLHAELVHVPLLLYWRGRTPEDGFRVPQQVRTVDVFPTLLTLANVRVAPNQLGAGQPLQRMWRSAEQGAIEDYEAYSEVHWRGHWARGLRRPDGKILHSHYDGADAVQFYEFSDAAETDDLAGAQAERARALQAELAARREELRKGALRAGSAAVDPATAEMLAQLGYVDDGEESPDDDPDPDSED